MDPFDAHVSKLQAAKAARIIHTFTIPEKTAKAHDGAYQSVQIYELSVADELRVSRETESDPAAYVLAMAKACFVGVNGVEEADPGKVYDSLPPKIRHLVTNAYNRVHYSDEADAFVESGSVVRRVG